MVQRRIKKFKSEENVHFKIVRYLRKEWPTVVFRTDYAAGKKFNKVDAAHHSRMQGGLKYYPDIFIAEPRGPYCGLYSEVKNDGVNIFTKKGDIYKNEHLIGQLDMLETLFVKGYAASFSIGFESFKRLFEWYMSLPPRSEVHRDQDKLTPKILSQWSYVKPAEKVEF